MADATYDVVKCESYRTPMLSYYTADRLIVYVCPSCVDFGNAGQAPDDFRQLEAATGKPLHFPK
jgi:hypothetical protein